MNDADGIPATEVVGAQPQADLNTFTLDEMAAAAHEAAGGLGSGGGTVDESQLRAGLEKELADVEDELDRTVASFNANDDVDPDDEKNKAKPSTIHRCKKGKHEQMGNGGLFIANRVTGVKTVFPATCLVCVYNSFARMYPTFDTGVEFVPPQVENNTVEVVEPIEATGTE